MIIVRYRVQKIRGLKRKCKNIVYSFYRKNVEFPNPEKMWYGSGWYMKPSISQRLIDSYTTPLSVKRIVMQSAIDEVERLISLRPIGLLGTSVNFVFNVNELFYSSIDIFYTYDSKIEFFKGLLNTTEILDSDIQYYRSKLISMYNVKLPDTLKVYHAMYEIVDEDIGKSYILSYWVVGEL